MRWVLNTLQALCPLPTSDLNSEIERLHIIGGDYLALASDFFTSRDEVLSRCEMYNETGKNM